MSQELHLDLEQLSAGLAEVAAAPTEQGRLDMIVRRPETDGREMLEVGVLSTTEGLEGDNWSRDPNRLGDRQLTLINARAAQLVAREQARWALSGDQLYVDLSLSAANLPTGTRLAIGDEAVIEVTAEPHTGCSKFVERFGLPAMKWVNSPEGRSLNLRGINTRVVQGGVVRVGDTVRKLG